MTFSLSLDLFPLIAAVLAAVTCGVLGNFLVLRRLSLMGDAISHSVLPGLVIAFTITASRNPGIMFLGAAGAGLMTVILVEAVKRLGRVESGAAMGVVFSVLFALGVLMIELVARNVDVDADCVLHGQLETLVWYTAPDTFSELWSIDTLHAVPRQVITLAATTVISIAFTIILFKELRIAAFDPALATTLGYHADTIHYTLMVFVAAATVASFEAVGSILVIAMLICPAATARLLTDRLSTQIVFSVIIAITTGFTGYTAATSLPALFEIDSLNAAGSMTVVAGLLLTIAAFASPKHGFFFRYFRRRKLATSIALDDVLAAIYRARESQGQLTVRELANILDRAELKAALAIARTRRLVRVERHQLILTDKGLAAAKELVRRHRLWESYLVTEAGIRPDHVHDTAETLEHLPIKPPPGPATDPHGREIPNSAD